MRYRSLFLFLLAACSIVTAQQSIDNSQARQVIPFPVRTYFPGVCSFGEMLVRYDQPVGQNVYQCGLLNDWHLIGGASSGPSSIVPGANITVNGSGSTSCTSGACTIAATNPLASGLQPVSTPTPGGACTTSQPAFYSTADQKLYTCSGGVWTPSGGSGSGTTTCATTSNLLSGNGTAGGCVDSGIAAGNVSTLKPVLGSILNQTNWTSLSGYTPNGATPSVTGGALVFTGGTNASKQTLDYNGYTNLERWTMSATFTVGTPGAATWGIGIGSDQKQVAINYSMMASMDASTGANRGKVSLYNNVGTDFGGAYGTTATSTTALTFSAGDSVQLSVERIQSNVIVNARNLTTETAPVSLSVSVPTVVSSTTPTLNVIGNFAIFNLGGTQTVTALSISSDEPVGVDVLGLGDSKLQGYNTPLVANSFMTLLQNQFTTVNAGAAGAQTADILNVLPQIIALKPKTVVLEIGSNDVRGSVSPATYEANYASIVSQLVAAGIKVYNLPLIESSVDLTTLNTYITSTYPTTTIPDPLSSYSANLAVVIADGIHPNALGHQIIAQAIQNYFENTLSYPITFRPVNTQAPYAFLSGNLPVAGVDSNGILTLGSTAAANPITINPITGALTGVLTVPAITVGGSKVLIENTSSMFLNQPGYALTGKTNSVFVGSSSAPSVTTVDKNTFVGAFTGYFNTTGSLNTDMGYFSCHTVTTGSDNSCFGANADVSSATAANRTVIGDGASGTADNTVTLGRTADTVVVPGKVTTPSLAGAGTATLTPQTGAGTGATAVCTTSHVCDGISGEVTLTSGSVGTPATGSQLIITLPVTRTNIPNCSVDVYGGTTFLGITKTATTSTITVSAGVALTSGTAYTVDYVCGGN